jgi:SP family myo-inositol transporter-like MFS transporter 13
MGFATNWVMLLCGRGIVGVGIGFASMTIPMYLAEVSPPELRGTLTVINNLFITGSYYVSMSLYVFVSLLSLPYK